MVRICSLNSGPKEYVLTHMGKMGPRLCVITLLKAVELGGKNGLDVLWLRSEKLLIVALNIMRGIIDSKRYLPYWQTRS